jgi:hypothetical protein
LGDYESLASRGRRAVRVALGFRVEHALQKTLSEVKQAAGVRPARKPAPVKKAKGKAKK